MHESELEDGLYHADNARVHPSYMLCSTTRKTTKRSWIIVYEMYCLPNQSAHTLREDRFCS